MGNISIVDKSLLPSKAHLHTKNNNRVIMRTHTHYERSSSPWNRKVLIWLWSFQTIGSIIVTAFAAALLDRRDGLQQRWDDGLADALFLITSFLVFSFTVINVIFTIPAYFHYKKDPLSPMWMMIGSVWMALFWLTVIAMSAWAIAWSAPIFEVYEVSCLLNMIAGGSPTRVKPTSKPRTRDTAWTAESHSLTIKGLPKNRRSKRCR